MNHELLKINQWLIANKLSLNVEKSSYLIFSKTKIKYDFKIKLGKSTLVQRSEATYLGVIIDNKLSWDPHIAKVKSKIAKTSWALTKVAKYVDTEVMKKIYFGLVYPHLNYSIACWGGSTKVNSVFIIQKRAIRAIAKAPWRASSSPLFKRLNILKLQDIYKLKLGCTLHKIKNKTWFGELNAIPINSTHNHYTRLASSDNYRRPQIHSNIGKHSFSFAGPLEWSKIPTELKHLSFSLFKKKYIKILIASY